MPASLETGLEILDGRKDEEIASLMVTPATRPDSGHDIIGKLQIVH
jgi:hypothetical protein